MDHFRRSFSELEKCASSGARREREARSRGETVHTRLGDHAHNGTRACLEDMFQCECRESTKCDGLSEGKAMFWGKRMPSFQKKHSPAALTVLTNRK